MSLGIFPNAHFDGMFSGFVTQSIGTLAICGWSFVTMSIVFGTLKALGMLRVTPAEEHAGLDISEHGMHAYPSDAIHSGAVA